MYCVPAGWLWAPRGFLYKLGCVDIAGSGGVHLVGGASALVSAWLVGPRLGRWELTEAPPMGSPTNALIGRNKLRRKHNMLDCYWSIHTLLR